MVPDASSESSKDGNADDSELDPIALSKWERCAAGLIGVVLAGFGVWAIFVVDSEVGPPALVLIAAVFLLLSVQGTAIRRANRDSVELDRRASPRQIAREAATLLEEEGPIEAEAFIEGASAAAPSLMRSPAFSNVQDIIRRARSYERDVRYAIESSMDYEIVLYSNQLDEDADFTLKSRSPNGQMIDCVVKYSEGIQRGFIASLREIIRRLQPGLRIAPVLVITNHEVDDNLTRRQLFGGSEPEGVEVVTWRGSSDTEKLKRVIRAMIEESQGGTPAIETNSHRPIVGRGLLGGADRISAVPSSTRRKES